MLRSPRPWRDLPLDLADVVAEGLDSVADDITDALATLVPDLSEHAAAVTEPLRDQVRVGVAVGVRRFPQLVGRDVPALTPQQADLYADIGASEAREGRSLEVLLGTYRAGSRLLLDAILGALDDHSRLDLRTISGITSAVFAFVDAMSAASAEGYGAGADTRSSAERQWRCRRIATQLLDGPADVDGVRAAAQAGGWQLSDRVQVVLLPEATFDDGIELLGDDAIVLEREADAVAVVPAPFDPAGITGTAPSSVVLGTEVGLTEVPRSLHLAERTAALAAQAEGPAAPAGQVHDACARLAAIALSSDPIAIDALAERRLAPLADLRATQRERLLETLHSWIRHWGRRADVAAELHVHPQTVGYRMGTLRQVYGDDLDDPGALYELGLVLGAWSEARQPLPSTLT